MQIDRRLPDEKPHENKVPMSRPTKSETNAMILDRAASLFAKHGFAHTSLQQIADALNYSKAGLLHHYPSKKALFDAVLEAHRARMREVLATISPIPMGIERDRTLIEGAVDYAFKRPGMSAFGRQLAHGGRNDDPRMAELGLALITILGIDPDAPDMQRFARVFIAMSGLNFVAEVAVTANLENELRDHIVTGAMSALGHHERVAPDGNEKISG